MTQLTELRTPGKLLPNEIWFHSRLSTWLLLLLCLILFPGTNVTAYALHPGAVDTELVRFKEQWVFPLRMLINVLYCGGLRFLVKTATAGAQTSIYCAVETGIEDLSGRYFRYILYWPHLTNVLFCCLETRNMYQMILSKVSIQYQKLYYYSENYLLLQCNCRMVSA